MTDQNTGAYRLSFLQQGLLYHSLVEPEAAFYVDQVVHTLRGDLDQDRFARVWRQAVERHEMLRTSFFWEDLEELVQVVHPVAGLPLEQHDWRDRPEADQEAALHAFLADDRLRGFDLEQPPLFRLSLVRHAEDRYTFVFRYHHLLFDAWSALMVLDEAFTDYLGEKAALREPAVPYRDYVAWLHRQQLTHAESYWREVLDGFTDPTPLPGAPAEPGNVPAAGETGDPARRDNPEEAMSLTPETTEALGAFCRERRMTLNSVFQSAWALLLARHSGQDDVVFGTTVSHRPADLEGIEQTAGLFINTLPVRARLGPADTFAACCERLQTAQGERRDHHHSPLQRVQEWSGLPSGTPLFDTITTFLNVPRIETLGGRDGRLRVERGEYRYRTNYPLSVMAVPGDELSVRIGYDPGLYDAGAVRRLLGQLRTVLETVAADPGVRIRDIPLLSPEETRRMVQEGNVAAPAEHGHGEPDDAFRLLTEQARRAPETTALVHGGTRLGYAETAARARRLAGRLRALGVGPDVPVGVCLERGVDQPVALLATLCAGGVYLPLDPAYPEERLALMLEDARPAVVLTRRDLCHLLPEQGPARILLDEASGPAGEDDDPLPAAARPRPGDLAYIIYTSGSTGRPKGTMLSHRGLVELIRAQRRFFGLTPDDRVLQWASPGFDASVFETVLALGSGAELHLADREESLPGPALHRLLEESGITVLTMPPSALAALADDGLPGLRLLIAAGEPLPRRLADRWSPGRTMVNAYGPTETTVWATAHEVTGGGTGLPAIGAPVPGFRAYVLDTALQPLPVGAAGELFLAGPGVGRGYLGQPARTAGAFLPDPFGAPGARMYRTGDLARWNPEGALEFLGRSDQQVKLRGFRIELGEIEAVLADHPDVRECAAVVRRGPAHGDGDGADDRIVAYAVLSQEAGDTGELRRHLEERLPAHMVPAAVLPLDRMPLTVSGKLDRAALPSPEDAAPKGGRVRPRTEAEGFVAEIWSEVLAVEDPGVADDFFETGGNSIKATQLRSRIKRSAQVDVPVRELLKARTLEGIALLVEKALAEELEGLSDEEIRALTENPA
ncbi:amino acid adenylation domain-containing protein [Streptomyces sp. JJ36]|uniref:amino acid adenylation domain-containing protein n=1 Tax=Streptomyces sp. JJ36 TaxID=2736645 RepID=UPI001F3DF90D|nr:amino acid adenylation domain-containing protein [Streptomyces sp. JJ36]MCF6525324.1 amino acid adenylation domain-containing protein [Streptomyces sp. JJ36]